MSELPSVSDLSWSEKNAGGSSRRQDPSLPLMPQTLRPEERGGVSGKRVGEERPPRPTRRPVGGRRSPVVAPRPRPGSHPSTTPGRPGGSTSTPTTASGVPTRDDSCVCRGRRTSGSLGSLSPYVSNLLPSTAPTPPCGRGPGLEPKRVLGVYLLLRSGLQGKEEIGS